MLLGITCCISLYLTLLIPPSLTIPTVSHGSITFNLSTPNEENQLQTVFTAKLSLIEGVTVIVENAVKDYGFFVIQAHSFQSNLTLSNNEESVIGTNIGLVQNPLMTKTVYQYNLNLVETHNAEVLLAVNVYKETDPIPGGCNMVYNTHDAPYQLITYDENMIKVDAAPPKGASCDVIALPRLDMYHLYLDEESFDGNLYFNGIFKFLTVKRIKKYGTKVSDSVKHLPLRRYYSAYRGTGSVFAIIATYHNSSSAYIPAISYACDINNWDSSCVGPVSTTWKVLCAVILFLGLFMCHFGHRFFRLSMFLSGFIFGSFIFYIAINVGNTISLEQNVGYALLFGFAYGICWLLLWWRFGIPILSVSLPLILMGYITACVVFHTGIADLRIFQSNVNYWTTVFCITIPITLSFLLITQFANILACSIVGATAVIIAVDHYAGASIHYIILNNVRRAIVPNFHLAILDPPFQYKDIILSFAWGGLVLFGVLAQRKLQIGKPPFPPHRSRTRMSLERAPLLASMVVTPYNEDRSVNEPPRYT